MEDGSWPRQRCLFPERTDHDAEPSIHQISLGSKYIPELPHNNNSDLIREPHTLFPATNPRMMPPTRRDMKNKSFRQSSSQSAQASRGLASRQNSSTNGTRSDLEEEQLMLGDKLRSYSPSESEVDDHGPGIKFMSMEDTASQGVTEEEPSSHDRRSVGSGKAEDDFEPQALEDMWRTAARTPWAPKIRRRSPKKAKDVQYAISDVHNEEKSIHLHEIRKEPLKLAKQEAGRVYRFAPDRGGDPLDRKAPLKDQFDLDLSRANRPELLKLLEAACPPSSHGNIRVMMYDGKIVSNRKDSPIKDFAVLPRITSIYVEGGRIEFWFRMDPRIRGCDITARIPVKTVDGKLMPYYGERDMKERARRFRNDAGISSWRRFGRLQATVDFMNELLSTEQRNSNQERLGRKRHWRRGSDNKKSQEFDETAEYDQSLVYRDVDFEDPFLASFIGHGY
ncbi:hypothetical protein ABVK25_011514 [Lepraria finkii]|uniref:Uncharacterized protein n=1 Tax=Lepraria finkii TaxID=1340010 RepID=A0ABR4ANY1_9LECA